MSGGYSDTGNQPDQVAVCLTDRGAPEHGAPVSF